MSQETLPHLPPAPDVPGPVTPESLIPGAAPVSQPAFTRVPGYVPPPSSPQPRPIEDFSPTQPQKTEAQVKQELAKATQTEIPVLEESPVGLVYLPGGLVRDGELIVTAQVRELNGFDEERLSRLVMSDNPAVYVTDMLYLGVVDLGGVQPTKDDLRSLLIGDRDALWLGIRIASYGADVEYKLTCTECDAESKVFIDLNEDIPTKKLEDPMRLEYEVELRKGVAKVRLLDGFAQEKFSTNIGKKTQAEINTIMLAHSVLSINGIKTKGEDDVRYLSSQDRGTIMDFIIETQPGPQIGTEIEVHCATCNAFYPIVLSPPSLFRF